MMMIWYLIEWQLTMMITMEIPTLEIRTSRFLISFCSKVTNRLYVCMNSGFTGKLVCQKEEYLIFILIINLCECNCFYLLPEKCELELETDK